MNARRVGIATLEDVVTIEAQPLAEYNLPRSTYELLQHAAAVNPDGLALAFFLQAKDFAHPTQFTHRQFLGRIHQAANLFHSLGLRPGEVVSLVLPNLPQTHFALWGGEAAGIANPINPLLEGQAIAEILRAAECKVLVTTAPFPKTDIWERLVPILDQVPTLHTVLTVDMAQYLPAVQRLAVKLLRLRNKSVKPRVKVLDFDAELKRQPADRLVSGRQIDPQDIAAYFCTGGTTGAPKLAQHTHLNEVYDAWAAGCNMDLGPQTVMFCGLPLFHVNGVTVTGLLPWLKGGAVVLGTPAGYRGEGVIANFWKIVEHYRINFFSGVPTVYSSLLNVPIEGHKISSLEYALCGAAPMPPEVFREFEKRTGVRILEGYGLTEAGCVSSVNPPFGERRIGSIGYHLPFQEMQIIKMDQTPPQSAARDEIGVVVVRGPNVFPGYKEAQHNQDIWIEMEGAGSWLNTGDLGRQDRDGYFWLTGRKKELIIRGGHNIDPQIIEGPLHRHPAVALAAAVGRPDPRLGEVPAVYVQLKPGAGASVEDLLQFAAENISERAAVPKVIRIIEQMPTTAVGKIFKPELAWREIQDVYQGEVQALPGVAQTRVSVRQDRLRGVLALVDVQTIPGANRQELEKAIRQSLGQYTIYYELKLT